MMTVFLRLLDEEDKAAALKQEIGSSKFSTNARRFEQDPQNFSLIPRSPFAYWITERVSRLFQTFPALEAESRTARGGMKTQADDRFLRASWECSPTARRENAWVPLCKGGAFSPFYADVHLMVDWWRDGRRPRAAYEFRSAGESWGGFGRNEDFYFRPGLTWSRRTQGGLSLRAMPAGCIFADKGPAAFVEGNDSESLLALLAVMNARAFRALVDLQMAFGSYEVGVIQRTPIPNLPAGDHSVLAGLARRAWSRRHSLDTRTETSHAFVLPALLQVSEGTLDARAVAWAERAVRIESELSSIYFEIDQHCFRLYGMLEADRSPVTEGFVAHSEAPSDTDDANADEAADESSGSDDGVNLLDLVGELISWTVGVAFGRFDLRLATGTRRTPIEPAPFDALPICSPGMLTREDGLPCEYPPQDYPIDFATGGILVDDPGHPRDLTAAIQAVFRELFSQEAETRWEEAAQSLAPNGQGVQRWLAGHFFEYHLKHYSKSRRRAPIYWQLGVPSGQYSVWLYAHQVTRNSLFELQKDVVAPKLAHEENRLADLRAEAASDASVAKRRRVEAQERHVEELRVMLEEVRRVAPLWSPFLDDGVVLAMAPLWRLVPQHRAWQRELKSRWDDLIDEKCEWARIAMHLWPERVVPKCTTDRSLAITHELDDAFWVEGLDRRWRQRGSIDSTMRYLEDGLLSESLRATVIDLQRFAQQHIEQQSEAGWWVDLKSGRHDDTPLALALWPERVLQRARTQPSLLSGLGLPLPARGFDDRALAALLRRYRPRHSEGDLEVLDAFCATFGNAAAWETRWADFDMGRLDEQALARFLYPRRVLARALTDHAFAAGHDLARWFWLKAPAGPRRLREPEEEVKIALAERDRPAVKAALKAFLEAPVAPGSARRERRARSA